MEWSKLLNNLWPKPNYDFKYKAYNKLKYLPGASDYTFCAFWEFDLIIVKISDRISKIIETGLFCVYEWELRGLKGEVTIVRLESAGINCMMYSSRLERCFWLDCRPRKSAGNSDGRKRNPQLDKWDSLIRHYLL